MMISRPGWVGHYNLHTAVWGVVLSFAFLSVAVANVICILLVKLKVTFKTWFRVFTAPVEIKTSQFSSF